MNQANTNNTPQPAAAALFAVELRTCAWAEMVAWYRRVLQLAVLARVDDDAYALLGDGGGRLSILGRDEAAPTSRRWSLAFEVGDLEAVLARGALSGQPPATPRQHAEGYREAVLTDPDGNRVRVFQWPANDS